MHGEQFDLAVSRFARRGSRRGALGILGGAFAVIVASRASAKPKKGKGGKPKRVAMCLDGQTTEATKKKKKKLLKRGATPGACSTSCTPQCVEATCGGADGCGGICGCGANAICHGGVCNACTVICDGNGSACGDALQTRLTGGGPVFACPGRYVGNFSLSATVALVGVGDGDDPATSTILDANGRGRVLDIGPGATANLHGLRITGGDIAGDGGGVRNLGSATFTACTVSKNFAHNGGGLINDSTTGQLKLTDSTVADNTARHVYGGGVFQHSTTAPVTLTNCLISGNTCANETGVDFGGGGGIGVYYDCPVDVHGSTITGNTARIAGGGIMNIGALNLKASSITKNEALAGSDGGGGLANFKNATFDSACLISENKASGNPRGGGIYNPSGVTTLNGAAVSGNIPNNCSPAGSVLGCNG